MQVTGRLRVIASVCMFINSHLHFPRGLTNVTVTARTVSFVDNMRSVSIFVFEVAKAFNLFCLPQEDENVFRIGETVHFENESFTKFFVSVAVRGLWGA